MLAFPPSPFIPFVLPSFLFALVVMFIYSCPVLSIFPLYYHLPYCVTSFLSVHQLRMNTLAPAPREFSPRDDLKPTSE